MTLRTPPLHPGRLRSGLRWSAAWQNLSAAPLRSAHRLARRLIRPLLLALLLVGGVLPAMASPGLCVGPVCGDEFSRSAQYHWQLRLRVNDQQGHRERLVVDCRSSTLSPQQGLVDRGYARAVARRACRLAGEKNG